MLTELFYQQQTPPTLPHSQQHVSVGIFKSIQFGIVEWLGCGLVQLQVLCGILPYSEVLSDSDCSASLCYSHSDIELEVQ